MPNPRAAALIAKHLPNGLRHPGDGNTVPPKLLPLPGLGGTGMPPEMAEEFAKQAGFPTSDVPQLIAEAVVALLENEGGFDIVDRTTIDELRSTAATLDEVDPGAPVVAVHCRCNLKDPIVNIVLSRKMILTSGALMRQRIDAVCTCPA